MKINAGNIKKGEFILYQDNFWQVQKAEFYSPGKGSALMRTKIKNTQTGKVIDLTFKSSELIEKVEVEVRELIFLYQDNDELHFMDERSFEQFTLKKEIIGKLGSFLKENSKIYGLIFNEKLLNIRPPMSVTLRVEKTEEAIKGDTVSGAKKEAILETGTKIMVPLFIKKGDLLTVNPETGEYTGKVNQ